MEHLLAKAQALASRVPDAKAGSFMADSMALIAELLTKLPAAYETTAAIETITKYRTTDGREFFNLASAKDHAENIDRASKANEILDNGGSVADAIRVMGRTAIDPIFERVTKKTKLVVSHWQCRDEAGYQVKHITPDCGFYVYGNAGSWSGSYGGDVSMLDLARYANDERTIWE